VLAKWLFGLSPIVSYAVCLASPSSRAPSGRVLPQQWVPPHRAIPWELTDIATGRIKAPELLLSRVSNSLAAQSTGSMGALMTAITNPRNHAPSRPKGARALGW